MSTAAGKFAAPLVLVLLVFSSNFIDPDLLRLGGSAGGYNFAIWFILATFCFACGYFMNKSLGWVWGGKMAFALIIFGAVSGLALSLLFPEYFLMKSSSFEKFLIYILRGVMLGSFSYFGMSVSEVFRLDRELHAADTKIKAFEETIRDAKKEADLIMKDVQIKAAKITSDAEMNAKNILLKKERIEKELQEFIQIEKELLRKYEEGK